MSRFLAPIHSWLFNKVKLHEGLEMDLVERFKSQYGDEIEKIVKDNIEKYGDILPNQPLEEIIDTNNIHGWLQNRISIAETRQAAILGDLFNKYNGNGIMLAKSVYEENGIKCGQDAQSNNDVDTAPDIYKTLNNYILDGMPCDNVNSVTKSEDDYLEYKQSHCLHIGYWKNVGVSSDVMYDLRTTWIGAFVSSANPQYKYQVAMENIGGQEGFNHKIFKK